MSRSISFAELLEAFEFVSAAQPDQNDVFLCKEHGTFHYHSEYSDEDPLPDDIMSERYIAIPHRKDLDLGKRLALRFAAEAMPQEAERVLLLFGQPGAYARFKALLEYRGMLERWYRYEAEAKELALKAWCADNAILIER